MAVYKILIKKSVGKDLRGIPKKDVRAIMDRIGSLAKEPRPPGCAKLAGGAHYRIRQGDYRIVYSVEDENLVIWVVKIGNRKEVYKH